MIVQNRTQMIAGKIMRQLLINLKAKGYQLECIKSMGTVDI
ncbi:hypothetical protein [Candidatus Ruthturnera calyptogenae]|nr:hypothetical protein [Candidatus Ruthturnera calyptogenae]